MPELATDRGLWARVRQLTDLASHLLGRLISRSACEHDAEVVNRPVSIGAGSSGCSLLGPSRTRGGLLLSATCGRLHAEFVGLFLRNDSDELGNLHDDVFHGLFGRTESTTRRECRGDLVELLERHPVHDRH